MPRWLPVMIALLLVGSFEMTWYLWYAPAHAAPWTTSESAGAQAWSVFLAILALLSFVYALVSLIPSAQRVHTDEATTAGGSS